MPILSKLGASIEPTRRACEMMLWLILFFAPVAFGATEWWSRAVLQGLIFILAVMCALRRDFSGVIGGPLYGFAAIVMLGAIQLIQTRQLTEPSSVLPFTLSRPQTFYALVMWAAFAALLWASSGILRWEGAIRRVALAIFVSGLFIAVVGILQSGQGNTAYFGLRPIRHGLPFGPFTNPDHAASWMVSASLLGAGLFADMFRRSRAPLAERVSKQALFCFGLSIQMAAIVETASRGALNALVASTLLTAFFITWSFGRGKSRMIVHVGLISAVCVYLGAIYFNQNWLGLTAGGVDNSTAYRLSMYRSGLRIFSDYPAFGVGLGNFAEAFRIYQEPFVLGRVQHIHSSWFEIALESGLLVFVFFVVNMLRQLLSLGLRLAGEHLPSRAVSAGAFAALLAFVLHGVVEFTFQIPANAVLFVVLLAMAEGLGSSPDSSGYSTLPRVVSA